MRCLRKHKLLIWTPMLSEFITETLTANDSFQHATVYWWLRPLARGCLLQQPRAQLRVDAFADEQPVELGTHRTMSPQTTTQIIKLYRSSWESSSALNHQRSWCCLGAQWKSWEWIQGRLFCWSICYRSTGTWVRIPWPVWWSTTEPWWRELRQAEPCSSLKRPEELWFRCSGRLSKQRKTPDIDLQPP